MSRGSFLLLLLTACLMGCGSGPLPGLAVDASVTLDANGIFRVKLVNSSATEVHVLDVKPSCSCVELRAVPQSIPRESDGTIIAYADPSIAPPSLTLFIFTSDGKFLVRVRGRSRPDWDRGAVYQTGVSPGDVLEEAAGIYVNGSQADVERQLLELIVDVNGIVNYWWGPLRPVESISNRWFVGLGVELGSDVGPDPVVGHLDLGGARIRVVLVLDP